MDQKKITLDYPHRITLSRSARLAVIFISNFRNQYIIRDPNVRKGSREVDSRHNLNIQKKMGEILNLDKIVLKPLVTTGITLIDDIIDCSLKSGLNCHNF